MVTWHLNGTPLHELHLVDALLTYGNMVPDILTVRHLGARYDADPLFAYGAEAVLQRVVIDDEGIDPPVATTVFRGHRRGAPVFRGPVAESLTYTFAGPWDWLTRRQLLQNQAVPPTEGEGPPSLVPQGLVILGQDDAGLRVNTTQALGAVLNAAITAGVPIQIGAIAGFDYMQVWDVVADLTISDAILRLLSLAPDAVCSIDYAVNPPALSLRRASALPTLDLHLAPDGAEWPAYVPLQSVSLNPRHDLVVPSVTLIYRFIDTVNGFSSLRIETDFAGTGAPTDENAVVRTFQLAGSQITDTTLSQPVTVTLLPAALTASGTITAASDPDAFAALSKFWRRKCPELAQTGITIKGFKDLGRIATQVLNDAGEDITPTLDTALNNELVTGAVTEWMEDSTLNRKAQDQTFIANIAYDAPVEGDTSVVFRVHDIFAAGVQATNCSTKTYSWRESVDETPSEEAPTGAAAQILAGLSTLVYDGTLQLIEPECSLGARPGVRINLLGGREEWETMASQVQSVTAALDRWTTDITLGWPKQLGADDIIELGRAGRLKQPAQNALYRATGA